MRFREIFVRQPNPANPIRRFDRERLRGTAFLEPRVRCSGPGFDPATISRPQPSERAGYYQHRNTETPIADSPTKAFTEVLTTLL